VDRIEATLRELAAEDDGEEGEDGGHGGGGHARGRRDRGKLSTLLAMSRHKAGGALASLGGVTGSMGEAAAGGSALIDRLTEAGDSALGDFYSKRAMLLADSPGAGRRKGGSRSRAGGRR
jgi:hypothetical protein